MQTNNKLREALTKILNLTNSLDEDCAVDPVEIRDIANAALAAPVKNCDLPEVTKDPWRAWLQGGRHMDGRLRSLPSAQALHGLAARLETSQERSKMSDISFPINTSLNNYQSHHAGRMYKHYAHAREKHPYFCDKIAPIDLDKEDKEGLADYRESVKRRLSDMRSDIKVLIKKGDLDWNDLVLCELWEVDEAIANGDTAHAVEECYDAIAVLLRAIDVLEGRQELGKPETKGEAK